MVNKMSNKELGDYGSFTCPACKDEIKDAWDCIPGDLKEGTEGDDFYCPSCDAKLVISEVWVQFYVMTERDYEDES